MVEDDVNEGGSGTGRWAVLLAGGIGICAVIGYGIHNSRSRAEVSAALADRDAQVDRSETSVELLLARAREARDSLDVATLGELADTLRGAAARAPGPERSTVELELADVLATQALEAAIRAHAVAAERPAAQRVAAEAIDAITPLLDALEVTGADPARVHATRARVALASGTDVLEDYPSVMLPTFRDEELRLAAMAGPVWRESDVPPEMVSEVVDALREAQRSTGLIQALLAIALTTAGEEEAALAVVDAMLQKVPSQPMARALRAELADAPPDATSEPAVVAVAETPDVTDEPSRGSAADDPSSESDASMDVEEPPTAPQPETAADEPATEPDEPVAEKPQPKPEPKKPAATESAPKKPAATESAPKKPAASKPEPAKPRAADYDSLAQEGCKKVQSGDAAAGFELLTKAFDLKPGSVQVIVCMAEAHHKLGRAASARAMAERALGKAPNNKRALTMMATLEAERGNRAGAEKYYRKLLEVDPNNAKAKAYLGEN
jgi:tetratricopeptide (TPR) repeat protein